MPTDETLIVYFMEPQKLLLPASAFAGISSAAIDAAMAVDFLNQKLDGKLIIRTCKVFVLQDQRYVYTLLFGFVPIW